MRKKHEKPEIKFNQLGQLYMPVQSMTGSAWVNVSLQCGIFQ